MAQSEELERDLGLWSVVAISMGAMIGSGIFILPGLAMAEAGPSVVLAFVVAGLLVLPAAVSIAELGTAMPEAGGDYIFIERGMGPAAGTIAGLGTWLMLMFKGALALVGGMFYLLVVVQLPSAEAVAITVGVVLILVNVIGVKQTGGLQTVMVVVMVIILAGFIGVTVGRVEGAQFEPFLAEGTAGLMSATAMVLISYGGVTKVAAVAEEIEDPGRNLPLGLLLSLFVTTGIYALIVFVLVGTIDADELEGSNIPMVDAVEPFFGFLGVILIVTAAMLALVSTANAGILTASRYPFALSRDNLLPELFAAVSDRFHTPVVAIGITGGAMLFIILALPVEEIAKTAGAFQIVVYILVCLALIAFRQRGPAWYDPEFTSPLYPWIQLFGVVSGVFILTQMDTLPLIGGVGIVVLGGLFYLGYGRQRVERTGLVGEALIETVEPGEATPEERPFRIVVPIASTERERELLQLAAANAADREDAEIVAMNVVKVPTQTSLAQEVSYEQERIERQQALLDEAREIAEELGIGLRTRAIVGRDVAEVVLDVIDDEDADVVVMGWSGTHSRREHILGSNIDRVIERAPCEVTLVRPTDERVGDVVVFVGEGPYSTIAVRQATAFVRNEEGATLTLVNVQRPDGDRSEEELREAGRALLEETAQAADVEVPYDTEVVVDEDVPAVLVSTARGYDTVCLGATRAGSVERFLSGTIPDRLGEQVDGTIVVVRGEDRPTRTLRRAIRRRLHL